MSIKLKIIRLDKTMPLPSYAHVGDAAFDLYASKEITLKPGERASVPTGLTMEIPQGFAGFVWKKSGLSHKHNVNAISGVIDSGYRGEVFVNMVNNGIEPYTFEKNHKIAQMVIQKCEDIEIVEVGGISDLSDSARGDGGFGSSGK